MDAYESWNISCTWRRWARSSRRVRVLMSRSAKWMVPPVGGSRPTTIRPSVDFPQPDSPTIPKVSPRRTVSEIPSTALTCAAALRRAKGPPCRG